MATRKKTGLGRGLSALMADVTTEIQSETVESSGRLDQAIAVDKIYPNPDQPRRMFVQDDLDDLAASIREKGVIQPLILRNNPKKSGTYEIVAGERRWRAAQIAQLHEVPALVRDYTDTETLEIAIIENIQRSDLNSIEEAAGYRELMDRFGHTQEKLAGALGKSRSYIANLLRLLSLPENVQNLLRENKLTTGHARTLITADNPESLAKIIITRGLSVRDAEKLVKQEGVEKVTKPAKRVVKDADTRQLEGDLSASLKMKVAINHKPNTQSGTLTISYKDFEGLDEICRRLTALVEQKN